MVSKYATYRAACIFAMADKGLTPYQILELQEAIADGFSSGLDPEEVAERVVDHGCAMAREG